MELNVKNVIAEGLAYTVMGIVVVFAVLVLIMLVIKAMALFSSEKTEVTPAPAVVPTAAPVPETKTKSDDTELIAVITAAIAAAMGKSSSGLVIRSYKKISGNVWNKAGRSETLENRF